MKLEFDKSLVTGNDMSVVMPQPYSLTVSGNGSLDIINNSKKEYSPYVLNFSLKNLKGETFMHYMEQYQIYLGYGSACNAKTKALENTLMAVYNDTVRASNAVRIGLSAENTIDEVKYFIQKLKESNS